VLPHGRRFQGFTEPRIAARPCHGCPHVFGLNARLHAVSYGDKDLIDLRIKVMASTGLPALGQ